ncbi:MAG TPA: penicillin-binding protein 2 [Steroidobacteraceae bacterium]|nr:penicillin-binding protein 2 [Steroidobacteraceae bacterium]
MPAGRIKDHWGEQRLFDQRSLIAGVLIVLLTFVLLGRLYLLQVVRHDYYAELSQGNRVRTEPIPASRGLILDRNGSVMVNNEPAYQLELTREQVPDLNDTLKRLTALNLIDPEDLDGIKHMILSRRSFDTVPLRLRLTDEEIGRFAVHRFEFPGVDLATRQTRHYPFGELGVHALGYVGAISEQDLDHIDRAAYAGTALIGKLGVEASYEKPLHGQNGYREILVNAQGRSVERQGAYAPELRAVAPTAGEDVVLSIDLPTQKVAEEVFGDHRGAVVAIDPTNGDVLALVSKPGFDPSIFARGVTRSEYAALSQNIDKPLFNRALRGTYPSGSTIKPVISLAGLANHMLDPHKDEFCAGVYYLPGSRLAFREGKFGRHGNLDLPHAIARSCDVYFYRLAATIGIDKIAAFMAPFGYGSLTGIDIGGEKPGVLPSPEWKRRVYKQAWYPGETVNVGIGQGYLLVTPLQLAHVASVIAGRGKSYRPRLVTALRDVNGELHKLPPIENPSIQGVTDEDWNIVIEGMIGATSWPGGTAYAFVHGTPYTMAGKTGTAEVVTVGRNQSLTAKKTDERLKDHAWFIAFAPAEAPRIAVAVLAENAGFGATTSSPIARKVIDAYLLGPDGKVKPSLLPGGSPAESPAAKPAEPAQPGVPLPEQKQAESPPTSAQAHKQS